MENRIIFLLVAILILFMWLTPTGKQTMKNIIAALKGETISDTEKGGTR